jgi:hypothetical protein
VQSPDQQHIPQHTGGATEVAYMDSDERRVAARTLQERKFLFEAQQDVKSVKHSHFTGCGKRSSLNLASAQLIDTRYSCRHGGRVLRAVCRRGVLCCQGQGSTRHSSRWWQLLLPVSQATCTQVPQHTHDKRQCAICNYISKSKRSAPPPGSPGGRRQE